MAINIVKQFNLNKKQAKFCEFYVSNGKNATQAALSAGYSPKSARVTSYRMLQNDNIQDCVSFLIDEYSRKTQDVNILTYEELCKSVSEIHVNCKKGRPDTALRAGKLLAELKGYEAPKKHEVVDKTLHFSAKGYKKYKNRKGK